LYRLTKFYCHAFTNASTLSLHEIKISLKTSSTTFQPIIFPGKIKIFGFCLFTAFRSFLPIQIPPFPSAKTYNLKQFRRSAISAIATFFQANQANFKTKPDSAVFVNSLSGKLLMIALIKKERSW
jgi:hypothetical protein